MSDIIGWVVVVAVYGLWLLDLSRPSDRRDALTARCQRDEADEFHQLVENSGVPDYLLEETELALEETTLVKLLRLRHALHRLAFCLIPHHLIGRNDE